MPAPQTEVVVTVAGSETGRFVFTPGDYLIGRNSDCPIRVEADLVAEQHATLILNFDHALIEDLGSANGTQVNGQPVNGTARLWPNQKIQIGAATIALRRLKHEVSDLSIAPAQAVVKHTLPEAFLREKKYDIGGVVAQGGMGAILDAKEATIERTVAMKVMLDSNAPDDLLRFLNEAKITGQLEHPNIVPVHELSVDENGQPFYTMKFVKGITLRKVLEKMAAERSQESEVRSQAPVSEASLTADSRPLTSSSYPLPVLLTIFQKVCDALAFAHSRGVIHRDLKPENIMVGDYGEVLLMDWGLAKRVRKAEGGTRSEDAAPADDIRTIRHSVAEEMPASAVFDPAALACTMAGSIMGTPQYMAPEQARGEIETLDQRADIYALGAILYHILALRPPVTGRDSMEVVGKVARGEIEPLECAGPPALWQERSDAAGDDGGSRVHGKPATAPPPSAKRQRAGALQKGRAIPDSLAAIVRKAMALDKTARYRSVEDLQADILAYQNGFATSAENAGAWKQFTLLVKRHKAASLGIAALLLVSIGFTVKVIAEGRRAERGEAQAKAEARRAEDALTELRNNAPVFVAEAKRLVLDLKFDEAIAKLDVAIALQPNNPDYRLRRAHLLQGSERLPEAVENYQRVLRLRPEDVHAQENLDLCQRVLALSAGQIPLNRAAQSALYDAVNKQGRGIDATPLARVLGKDAEGAEKLLWERLRPLTKDPRWTTGRIARLSNGTLQVNLTEIPFPDLSPLKGLPISDLNLSWCGASDLRPLGGMPLRNFYGTGAQLKDISPLKGAPLRSISLHETLVTDLTAIADAPLQQFTYSRNFGPTPVVDLSPLRGKSLRNVSLSGSRVVDLSVIATWSQLEDINLSYTAFSDLRLLAEKPIKTLILETTYVSDLSYLRGMPIVELVMTGTKKVTDYSPLLDLPKLTRLRVNADAALPPGLLQHPTLKEIGFDSGDYIPVVRLRAEYDARKKWQEPHEKNLAQVAAALPALGMADGKTIIVAPWGVRVVLNSLPVTDISGLRALPIDALSLFESKVADLAPLRGMRLKELSFAKTDVKDVSPLLDMPILESAMVTQGATNLGVLRDHPTLKWLGWEGDWDKDANRPKLTTAEFWARYDAQQAAGKK